MYVCSYMCVCVCNAAFNSYLSSLQSLADFPGNRNRFPLYSLHTLKENLSSCLLVSGTVHTEHTCIATLGGI